MSGVLAAYVSIAVNTDFIAEFTAKKLIKRYTVSFSGKIPQCNFDTGHTAALSGRTAELFDFSENLIYVAWIFSKNSALQHQSISFAGGVSYFTVTADSLICHKFQNGASLRRTINIHKAHVCDP